MKRIKASEELIQKTKKKFVIFSALGVAVVGAISIVALSYHSSVIHQQSKMQSLHETLSKQMLLIHDIAIFGERFNTEHISNKEVELKKRFNGLIENLNTENKKFFETLKETDLDSFNKLEAALKEKGLKNAMVNYIERARELGDKQTDTLREIKEDIKFLALNSREGLSEIFAFARDQIKKLNKESLGQLDRMGFVLIFLCLLEIVLAWFLAFRPFFSTVIEQHEKLKEAVIEVENSSRSRSEFLANISHEIRTPMTAILGYTEKLEIEDGLKADDRKKFLRIVNQNANHLLGLIDEILDVSKIESGKLKINKSSANLPQLLNEIYSALNVKAQEKKIDLRFENKNEIPKLIKTDPKRLKQILFNIIGNAIKFTDKGFAELSVEFIPRKNQLKFLIKDTGRGISKEDRKKLFRPFEQIDNSGKREFGGTGLGLVLSKNLAIQMGGDVVIAGSRPGVGTTFKVEISAMPIEGCEFVKFISTGVDEENPRSKWDQNPLRNCKVLVVDDAKENARLFKMNLAAAGAEVDLAYDGFQALKKAQEKKFDLILLDIQMPGKDGFETLSELRSISFDKPVIALTAHGMQEERDKTNVAGFDGHITKPVKADVLISSVIEHITSV